MDYVFGVMVAGEPKLICGIWSELQYLQGAASSIMNKCAEMAMSNGNIREGIEIMSLIASIPEEITQKDFDKIEESGSVMVYTLDHFMFNFMTMGSLQHAMESETNVPVVIGAGGDHRKCANGNCSHSPTQEQLDNGWVPWETTGTITGRITSDHSHIEEVERS